MSEDRYPAFGKIPRHRRPITITEKIDGTNGLISIETWDDSYTVRAGGRTRWLSPGKETDSHGFAQWVQDNEATLITDLGVGLHFGEFWGHSINRGYGLPKGDKRFSLFNVSRWAGVSFDTPALGCVHIIAGEVCWESAESEIFDALAKLEMQGSRAVPGYMNPEGIVIYQHSSNRLSKITIEKDAEWKGKPVQAVDFELLPPQHIDMTSRKFFHNLGIVLSKTPRDDIGKWSKF